MTPQNLDVVSLKRHPPAQDLQRGVPQIRVRIRRSILGSFGALDVMPARSFVIAVVLLVMAAYLDQLAAWVVVLCLGPALVALEAAHTRDFVTDAAVVRQRGLLGRSRSMIRLSDVMR